MIEFIQSSIPALVFFSHLFFVVLVIFVFGLKNKSITSFIGKNSNKLVLGVSLAAIIGSLFYSNIIGFPPCVLCWWQRVFLYPIFVISIVGLLRKNKTIFQFIVPLAVLSGIVGLLQSYANLGGSSILPCTAVGGECSKVYVLAFGYITIPVMSVTISLYILFIAWVNNLYENSSNS